MTTITIHTCTECDYYQEPFNDYPERGVQECYNCNEWVCDECAINHVKTCCFSGKINNFYLCSECYSCGDEIETEKCKHCHEKLCSECKEEHARECCCI